MKQSTHFLILSALCAALCAVCSQIAIPLPLVPINLALFAVHLSGALLGTRYGTISMLIYLLLGLIGIPVFQNFKAGPTALFGPTGGYLIGYVLAAAIAGLTASHFGLRFPVLCIGMIVGTLLCYAFGTVWFIVMMHMGVLESLTVCVVPFLPGDGIKILLAATLARRLYPMFVNNFSNIRKQN